MAISINCCLKPSIAHSPPPISPPLPTPRMACNKDSRCCMQSCCMSVIAACMIISCTDAGVAVAVGLPKRADGLPVERKSVLWSDKIRKCPPWRANSLENVMPENLPRRSDRRRTDGFVSDLKSAPAVWFNKSCYSL